MVQALEVFFNGIGGVFAGIGMLYLSIRLISLVAGRQAEDKEE